MPELMLSLPLKRLKQGQNYRKHLGAPEKLAEMAESMREHGVLEPLIVRPLPRTENYELVCGYRRFAAAEKAELDAVPVLVRELTDDQVLDVQIIENSQREDVHPLDEADAFAQSIDRGRTAADLAEKIGRPLAFVVQRLQLLKLCKEARKALDDDEITLAVAQLLARIPDAKLQAKALEAVRGNTWDPPMKAEEARKHIETRYMLRLEDAPFDVTDANLVAEAGACNVCPKRTGAQRELFADIKSPDVCTDLTCFGAKKAALYAIRIKEAKEAGQKVLEGKAAQSALSYGSEYVQLDESRYTQGKSKSVRSIVAKAKAPIILAKSKDGEIYELVRNVDLQKALPKAEQSKTPSGSIDKANKDRVAKERRRALAVNRTIGLAVERAAQLKNDRLITLLVRSMISLAWHDTQTAIIRRRELEPKEKDKKSTVPAEQRLKQYADKLSVPELAALGLEIALRRAAPGNYGTGKEWSEVLAELKVDYAKICREVDAEARAKAKAKAKPEAKAKPKPTPTEAKKGAAKKATGKKAKAKAKRGGNG
jgi:ParB/RepB/Spo0J family partition protein